jgi:hypothetical protein
LKIRKGLNDFNSCLSLTSCRIRYDTSIDENIVDSQGDHQKMKKLVIMALGLSLAIGTTIALAQDSGSGSDTTKKKKKKKKTSDTTTAPK